MDFYNENNPIRIVLADDHEVVRAGIKRLLSIDKSIKIVDEAANGKDALNLVEYHSPDLLLTDIMMPVMDGIECVNQLNKKKSNVMTLMLTAFEDKEHLDKAIEAGADGYLTKDVLAKELIEAIKTIMKGERSFSKSIIKLLQNKYVPSEVQESATVSISKREQEILNHVAMGKTSQEIAEALFLSIRTVESHRYNIMKKLDVKNTAGLVRYSITHPEILK